MSGIIKNLRPQAGVEGGEVIINCENYDTSRQSLCGAWFGDQEGNIISASPARVIVAVP